MTSRPPPSSSRGRQLSLFGEPPVGHVSDQQREIAEARALILAEVDRLAATLGLVEARVMVAAALAAGSAAEPLLNAARRANARASEGRVVSARTLQRWHTAREASESHVHGLVPTATAGTEMPPWLPRFLPFWQRPTKPSIQAAMRQFRVAHPEIALPSERTVQRRIRELGPLARNRGRMGPRELRKFRAHRVRTIEGLEPMDVITADGHAFKAEVSHPVSGRPFRPEIVSVMDVATRKVIGWSCGLAESSWLVRDAYRAAIAACGVPAIAYTDRGCGFTNEQIVGALGLLSLLDVDDKQARAWNPQARGAIEIIQRTLWGEAARELVTYIGPDMDREAKALVFRRTRREQKSPPPAGRQLLISWDDFRAKVNTWIDRYNNRHHETLGCTPQQRWNDFVAQGWQPEALINADIADMARPREKRRVNRAQVSLGSKTYFAAALEQYDLHGTDVQVGYDIHDPAQVWVYTLEGRFLTTAQLNGNASPYFSPAAVDQARLRRLEGRLRRLDAHRQGALEEVADLTGATGQPAPADMQRQLVAATPAPAAAPVELTPRAREERWWQRAVAIMADPSPSVEDAEWLATVRSLPWFKARSMQSSA